MNRLDFFKAGEQLKKENPNKEVRTTTMSLNTGKTYVAHSIIDTNNKSAKILYTPIKREGE